MVLGVAAIVCGGLGLMLMPGLPARDRLDRGLSEVRSALVDERYNTDTGLRIAMWRWALAAAREHPVLGVGAGGYQAWASAQTREDAERLWAPARAGKRVHAHAHSWYLHALATTGVLGAAMLFTGVGLGVVSGLAGPRDGWRAMGIDAGPALGLVGLLAAGVCDSIHVNQQTAYMLFVLLALCLPMRPRAMGERRLRGDRA